MPRHKKARRSEPSSELGSRDFAANPNVSSKGRAIRKCRKQPRESPFQDSALAISDPEDDEDEEVEVDDVVSVAPSRKRKRSPSPELSLPSDQQVDTLSDSDDSDVDTLETPPPGVEPAQTTIHLTVNVPAGHQGPITLQLDPANLVSAQQAHFSKPDRLTQSTIDRLNARSKPRNTKRAGFLDLPAELRNDIYRSVFVADSHICFNDPVNFDRSSQLLRTCRQVHEEGRSILYSENHFNIERRTQRHGSFWSTQWREVGYLNVRKFMKSIGLTNTALIRHITMMLEDAVPCLNPEMRTNEDRRFVHDDDLMSVLRHLGNHSELQTLTLHFHGRRRVDRTDDRFLDYMKRIKADTAEFVSWPPGGTFNRPSKQDEAVKAMLLKTCSRRKKRFD